MQCLNKVTDLNLKFCYVNTLAQNVNFFLSVYKQAKWIFNASRVEKLQITIKLRREIIQMEKLDCNDCNDCKPSSLFVIKHTLLFAIKSL